MSYSSSFIHAFIAAIEAYFKVAQSARAVEYRDFTTAEG